MLLPYRSGYYMTRLPQEEEMVRRLCNMDEMMPDTDLNFFLREMVYAKLRKHAGEDMTAQEIVRMLYLAIFKYIVGAPSTLAERAFARIPALIDTLVDNKLVAAEAHMAFVAEKHERVVTTVT